MEQVSQTIAKGILKAGDKLPAVRKLAAELVVNPNTVANAYRLLEKEGLLTTKTGSGTFVGDPKLRSKDISQLNALAERMDTLIGQGVNLGFSGDVLMKMFKDRLGKFTKKS